MNIYINPLSVIGQCVTIEEAAEKIRMFLDNINYMGPAIKASRLQLHYDPRIESRELISGKSLSKTISEFKKHGRSRDLIARWYLATKNSSTKKLTDEPRNGIDVEVNSVNKTINTPEQGKVHEALATKAEYWLSLCSSKVFSEETLHVSYNKGTTREIKNISTRDNLIEFLPRYESNPKHRKQPYYDKARKEHVASMPLDCAQAQDLLLASIKADNGDYLGRHKDSGKLYRFKKTHVDKEIYHGFQVEEADIPRQILKLL